MTMDQLLKFSFLSTTENIFSLTAKKATTVSKIDANAKNIFCFHFNPWWRQEKTGRCWQTKHFVLTFVPRPKWKYLFLLVGLWFLFYSILSKNNSSHLSQNWEVFTVWTFMECLFEAGKAFIGTRGTLEVLCLQGSLQGTKFSVT